ncbi:MAG TPA: hypothetical protein VMV52_04480 [Candidatus Nanopelagicaceae bacterium]|nr:hypothetical protein [Candidatus Nanopelagicaceae bacterium]
MGTNEGVTTELVVDHFMPGDNHHPQLGFYVHQSRRKYLTILISVAAISALLSFALTWAFAGSRPIRVTLALPTSASASATPTPTPTVNANSSGQVALTEDQLKAEVRKVGGSIFWAGGLSGAKYAFTHLSAGKDYIRYLPGGQGIADVAQNYRVIATYQDPTAYDTIVAAAKLKSGVSLTNPDGSVVYYAKATPTHVYMAFKGLDYQIEIFDPVPGASLQLATTPGAIAKLL